MQEIQNTDIILNVGGSNGKLSEETKKLISLNHSKVWLGKHHSDETKNLLREINKGRIITWKDKISKTRIDKKMASGKNNPMYGKSVYDVWVEKYGLEIANQKMEEYKKKLSKSIKGKMKGVKLSEEHRKKISENRKGAIVSKSTREKISNSNKGKYNGDKNPMFTKYIIEDNNGNVIEIYGRDNLLIYFNNEGIAFKKSTLTKFLKMKSYKGYILINKIRNHEINK